MERKTATPGTATLKTRERQTVIVETHATCTKHDIIPYTNDERAELLSSGISIVSNQILQEINATFSW